MCIRFFSFLCAVVCVDKISFLFSLLNVRYTSAQTFIPFQCLACEPIFSLPTAVPLATSNSAMWSILLSGSKQNTKLRKRNTAICTNGRRQFMKRDGSFPFLFSPYSVRSDVVYMVLIMRMTNFRSFLKSMVYSVVYACCIVVGYTRCSHVCVCRVLCKRIVSQTTWWRQCWQFFQCPIWFCATIKLINKLKSWCEPVSSGN